MEIKLIDGSIDEFINNLEPQTVARVLRTLDLLEAFGYRLGMPHSKKISAQLFELRVVGKQSIRLFYTFNKNMIVILHCFIKKSQKTPKREISMALAKVQKIV